MDLFKNSSKQSLSLQKHGESSTAHITPLSGKCKQSYGEVFTHFISFPLAMYSVLKDNFEVFRTTVLRMGFDDSLFASPSRFHLTVVMLTLKDEKAVDEALRILKSCMEESLDKTRVLYAPVEEVGNKGRLLSACHIIIDAFVKAEFAAEDAKSNLKLHFTMMNASYRKDKIKRMETFNAQKIHEKFGDKDWGSYLIREAQISKRSSYDPEDYFESCGSLSMRAG